MYSYRLEPLTSMRECKSTVLSWRCFLPSRRSCASIDSPVYEAMSNIARATKHIPSVGCTGVWECLWTRLDADTLIVMLFLTSNGQWSRSMACQYQLVRQQGLHLQTKGEGQFFMVLCVPVF